MGELTVGSLFSGIGGLELGLERAGMKTIWQVEMDDYATRVLERHWPDATRHRDVREVGAHNLPPVDLICGGFPCQDISLAGKGAGLAGERSGLWSEFARIVRELRPRYVLVENVAALLARGLGDVLGDLAACGYDAEWDCIPAAAVGAHHRRDRLFIVAHSQCHALREQPEPEPWSVGADVSGFNGALGDVADADGGNGDGRRGRAGGRPESADGGGEYPDPDSARLAQREECDAAKEAGSKTVQLGCNTGGFRDALAHADDSRLEEREVFGGNAREELQAAFRGCRTGGGVWEAEPAVGGTLDGFSAWLDDNGGRLNADATKACTREDLRILRERIESEGDGGSTGGPGSISPASVLLAFVRQLEERPTDEARVLVEGEEASEGVVRGMRSDNAFDCPPRRPEQSKQRAGEHSDSLQVLSQLLARDAEAAWSAYRRSDAATPMGWEAGFSRVTDWVPSRVDRLRGLGNAVVPQVAEFIGRRIVAMESRHAA